MLGEGKIQSSVSHWISFLTWWSQMFPGNKNQWLSHPLPPPRLGNKTNGWCQTNHALVFFFTLAGRQAGTACLVEQRACCEHNYRGPRSSLISCFRTHMSLEKMSAICTFTSLVSLQKYACQDLYEDLQASLKTNVSVSPKMQQDRSCRSRPNNCAKHTPCTPLVCLRKLVC